MKSPVFLTDAQKSEMADLYENGSLAEKDASHLEKFRQFLKADHPHRHELKTHSVFKKAFKYQLYPTKQQEQALLTTHNLCHELYNASLEERKEAYRMSKVTITYNQQANQLPDIKELRPAYNDMYSQVLQDTLRRVHKAMQNFFRRVKAGEKAGYPRYKSYNRFDSFTYAHAGFSLTQDNRVSLKNWQH